MGITLAGCMATPPAPRSVEITGHSELAGDLAWAKLNGWIVERGGHLTASDRATGTLWAEIPVGKPTPEWESLATYADCGDAGATFTAQATSTLQAVLSADGPGTALRLLARYSELRQNIYPGTTQTVACNSTGKLEREALAALQ